MTVPIKQAHRGNYTSGRAYPIEYIVVHYTANRGDTARNNLNYFAREVTGTSAHYFVDENEVCQSVLDTDTAWHCGSSSPKHPYCRNANSIGVEMCNSAGGVPEAVRARTAALVRELMDKYGVDSSHVLRHYDVTGKKCPAPWVDNPGQWTEFKSMLEDNDMLTQEQFNAMADKYFAQKAQEEADEWAKPYIKVAVEAGAFINTGTEDNPEIAAPKGFPTRQEVAVVVAALRK